MNEIRIGMESGLDVSVYMDPEYSNEQMKQIRYGMEHDLDVSKYADPSISVSEMKEIRQGLEAGNQITGSEMSDINTGDYGKSIDAPVYGIPGSDFTMGTPITGNDINIGNNTGFIDAPVYGIPGNNFAMGAPITGSEMSDTMTLDDQNALDDPEFDDLDDPGDIGD